jgi:hypothetical protein
MSLDGAIPDTRRTPASRHMRVFDSVGVEHLFKTGDGPVMQIMSAIPTHLREGIL